MAADTMPNPRQSLTFRDGASPARAWFETTSSYVRRRPSQRRGATMMLIIFAIVALGLVAGGIFFVFNSSAESEFSGPLTFQIEKGPYISQVLDQGEIVSSANVEFRCEVKSRTGSTSVISVIPEGTQVNGGELLIELDSASIEAARDQQKIVTNTAEASQIQAVAALAAAKEAKNEYFEGTFLEMLKQTENQIAVAKEELRKAQQALLHNRKLEAKGYVSQLELEASEFAVVSYQNSLDLAMQQRKVLLGPTKRRMEIQYTADIKAAEVRLENEVESYEIEMQELAELEEQVKMCKIYCPEGVSGQIVYANVYNRRGSEWVLEEGATVRERQVLIRLPDLENMEVKATVNESQITSVQVGMPVIVNVDALDATSDLRGEVNRVNAYAEPDSYGGGGVKKYGVGVKIMSPPPTIRPGMNASITIQTEYQDSALQVPLQCLYDLKGRVFCLVKEKEQYRTVELKVNSTNEKRAWIAEDAANGIVEGTSLVMNPRDYRELMDLPVIADTANQRLEGNKLPPSELKVEQPAGGPGGGGGLFKRLDKDGDGKISGAEIDESPDPARIRGLDKDGDGEISAAEASAAAGAGRPGGGGPGGGGKPGGGGGGPGGGGPGGGGGEGGRGPGGGGSFGGGNR